MLPTVHLFITVILGALTFHATYQRYDHLVSTGAPDTAALQRGLFSKRWLCENLATMLLALLHAVSCCLQLVHGALVLALVDALSAAFFLYSATLTRALGDYAVALEDLPPCAIPELRRPRYSLYAQRLAQRMAPLRGAWLAWGLLVSQAMLREASPLWLASPAAAAASASAPWDWGVRGALGALLAASAAYSLAACSARDSWGGQTPQQDGLLWPPGQAGEHAGQVLPAPEVGALARPHATRPLRVLFLTVGTRGDVQPYIALGQHLREVGGHAVTIASSDDHAALVTGAGLAFASIGVPRIEQPVHWLRARSVADMIEATGASLVGDYDTVARAFLAAAEGRGGGAGGGGAGSGGGARADVLIGTAMTLTFAANIGEALGIPAWTAKLAPDLPSRAFPLPGGAPSALGALNWLQGLWYWVAVARAVARTSVSACEDQFRTRALGLPPVDPWARLEAMTHTPQLLGFSRALFPAPLDYPPHAFQCGFWLNADSGGGLYDPHTGQVAPALRAYVEAPEAPALVCVTFGSMENGAPGVLAAVVGGVLARGLRCVVLTGGLGEASARGSGSGSSSGSSSSSSSDSLRAQLLAGAAAGGAPADRLFLAPSAPHAYLFPRCALVVHHGGAGTTSRALHSGVPSLVIPVLRWSDQMLWGELVERRGVGLVLRGEAPGAGEIGAALAALLPPEKVAAKGASMAGAALRGERSCAAVAALLTACLCRLTLAPEAAARARAANAPRARSSSSGSGGGGALSLAERNERISALGSAGERMCARHCVPCNAWRVGIEGPRGGAPSFRRGEWGVGGGGGGGGGAGAGAAVAGLAAPSPRRRASSPSASAPPALVGGSARKAPRRG